MGSKCRLIQRVRTNADYQALTRHLDTLGLRHRVVPPEGKGHPGLMIRLPSGEEARFQIACSPRGGLNSRARVAELKRWLASRGL
ncbi:hypothetical protein EYE35_01200 [Cereibacter sphaeroides]|nr:hypothetical protein EYE35_01200 [Cereibacter sphaeroides]